MPLSPLSSRSHVNLCLLAEEAIKGTYSKMEDSSLKPYRLSVNFTVFAPLEYS